MKYRHDIRLIMLTVNGTHVGLLKRNTSNSKNKRLLKQNDKRRN